MDDYGNEIDTLTQGRGSFMALTRWTLDGIHEGQDITELTLAFYGLVC